MDIPAKKLVKLLDAGRPSAVRAAAVVVCGELGVKDAAAELLAALWDEDDAVRLAAIPACGALKLPKALPVFLDRIPAGGAEGNLCAEAAARLGPAGVKGLHDLLHTVAPGVRKAIAAALSGAGGGGAEAGVGVLRDHDPAVVAGAAAAIAGRVPELTAQQKGDLVAELVAFAGEKAERTPAAEQAVVKLLAALNDPAAADVLWDRTGPPHPPEVRAAALRAVGGWVQAPTKDQWKRLFAAAADPLFPVAAPALMILNKQTVSLKQLADWAALFHAPDQAARRLALEKVGDTDAPAVVAGLMAQLNHPDQQLREAARAKLAATPGGRAELAKGLLAAETADALWPLARAVAPFAGGFDAARRAELLEAARDHIDADDGRAEPLLFLLRATDAHGLRDALFDRAVARRKKKQYPAALKYLKLLGRDPAAGLPVRLELALCGLKLSAKELAADQRAADPCLRQFEPLVSRSAAEVLAEVGKAKWLEADDLFYLGFHFAERHGPDRQFGADLLRLVVKQYPKAKVVAAAKNKLKAVG
jgi:HEAT repeat protein